MSLLGRLRAASLAVEQPADPWLAPLQRVHGKVEFDGLERVSSQTLLDMLEVPQRCRTAGTFRRLSKLIAAGHIFAWKGQPFRPKRNPTSIVRGAWT